MKLYRINIKSHTETATDFEDEVEARSKEEASEIFAKRGFIIHQGIDLLRFITEI